MTKAMRTTLHPLHDRLVEMATAEDADAAAKKFNGQVLDSRTLKVEGANSAGSGGAGRGGASGNRGTSRW